VEKKLKDRKKIFVLFFDITDCTFYANFSNRIKIDAREKIERSKLFYPFFSFEAQNPGKFKFGPYPASYQVYHSRYA
jgi:hypothetical protein